MKRLSVFTVAAACLLAALSGVAIGKKPKREPGFQPLFNGKDLSGWHKNPMKIGHGTGGHWAAEDGEITGENDPPGSGNGGILLSDRQFGDFEITLETKTDWGVDSGLFLRSTQDGKCYQVMLDYHENGNVGEVYREGEKLDGMTNRTFRLDGIYADPEKTILRDIKATRVEKNNRGAGGQPLIDLSAFTGKIWKVGQWNTIRARIHGDAPHITTWVNGNLTSEFTGDGKYANILLNRGSIALQVHGGRWCPKGLKARYRNIQIKEL